MRIRFHYPHNEIIAFRTHIGHHADLYSSFVIGSLQEKQRVAEAVDEKPAIWSELNGAYFDWACNEVRKLAFVSLYHLWEQQICGLLDRQINANGGRLKRPNKADLVVYVAGTLRSMFGISMPTSIVARIDIARLFVNAVKHGSGRALTALKSSAPELFAARSTAGGIQTGALDSSSLLMPEAELARLVDTLDDFWDAIPYEMVYSTNR